MDPATLYHRSYQNLAVVARVLDHGKMAKWAKVQKNKLQFGCLPSVARVAKKRTLIV